MKQLLLLSLVLTANYVVAQGTTSQGRAFDSIQLTNSTVSYSLSTTSSSSQYARRNINYQLTPPPQTYDVLSDESVSYNGPLIIRQGGSYSGNWESQNPKVPVIDIRTNEPVIIENSNLRGRGNLISGFGSRVTIRNVNGYGLNPNVAGQIVGKFANLEEFKNIIIENNYIEGTSGIYIREYRGDPRKYEGVRILRNYILNTDGRRSDGEGGFTDKRKITQTIFFNHVQRIPQAEIAWNQIINEPGKSLTEENINMYVSSGIPESPILIHNNYIQGAYNAQPWRDKDYSGGGILLGDGVTKNPSEAGHIRVYNNQVVNASNHSLSITGGIDNQIYNNRVVFSGRLPDGRIIADNLTAGSIIWDSNNQMKFKPPTFYGNILRDNYFAVTNLKGDGSLYFNQPWWTPSCKDEGMTCSHNIDGGQATMDMERKEYELWLSKVLVHKVKIGSSTSTMPTTYTLFPYRDSSE
ncbi:hypothetical protein [Deinococcus aquatilis]|uniref:hypothetical protein n=1 Tax=Deinococcus aquatilis TaxID=519440 RepID=UPI0003A26EB0|nr:hypothetical protein [Deinococcus aquatilis]